jgi:hypothetical protein
MSNIIRMMKRRMRWPDFGGKAGRKKNTRKT